jgi:polyvinyl alcohol dehydrogenase (cytochrome)
MALDMDSGKILWSKQMTQKDAYTAACRLPDKTNCAESNGPDFDFSSSPILLSLANGRRMIVAGQKSGIVHALDPDKGGEVLWQTRVGRGGTMGGVQWGSAADQSNVYVALSDIGRVMLNFSNSTDADPKQGGGMFALRLEDGERVWYTPPPGCGTRPTLQPCAIRRGQRDPWRRFLGIGRWPHARVLDEGRRDHLGLRYHPRL